MIEDEGGSAEQRLHDAVARWDFDTGLGLSEMLEAACQALVDGLDSQALRELAGASAKDSSWDIRELVSKSLDELRIPSPGTIPPGFVVAKGGLTRRPGTDTIRFSVVPEDAPAGSGFQVLVHINGMEMTSAGAGLGMDPYDLLIPTNLLVPGSSSRSIPIARCTCGVYGCGATDVTITCDGDLVHWDWSKEKPMNRGVSFPAPAYEREIARVAADHSWETLVRTAGRLVLTHLDRARLPGPDLRVDWVGNDHLDHELFLVALRVENDYQVFIRTPWQGRVPEQLAREVCATLTLPPREWDATWRAMKPALTEPPAIAGPSWRRHQPWRRQRL